MLARLKEKQRSCGGLSSGQHGQILAIRRESRWIRREKRYARRAGLAGIIARSFSPETCIVRSQRRSLHRAPGRSLPDLPRGTRAVVQHDLERIPQSPLEVASVADSLSESPFTAKRDIFNFYDDDTLDDEHLDPRGASFICSICGESNECFTPKRCVITESCTHKRDVCTPCLQSHLTARYEYLGWDQLNCPTCKARFDCADMRKWAPKSLYQKYVAFELQRCCENSSANYVRCPLRRKNGIQCDGAGDYDPKYQSFVDCETCGGRYCVDCRIEWHAGTSCKKIQQQKQKEQRQRSEEQKLSAMFVEKECKRCPNEECGVPIQKTDGCDHITCKPSHQSISLQRARTDLSTD